LKIENLTDDQKNKCVTEFKTRCYFVYRIYQITKKVFGENKEIFDNLESPKIINDSLIDHIILQFHIITDSACFGKSDKNLSVFFFLEWGWEADIKDKLSELANKLKDFVTSEKNKNPRHKLLAHWDVDTILNESEALGAFEPGAEMDFFKNLNEFIQILQKEMGHQDDWDILTDKKTDEIELIDIIKKNNNPSCFTRIKKWLTNALTRTFIAPFRSLRSLHSAIKAGYASVRRR
jgi:hypothetical protein